jgi:hypothetical protein
MEVPAESRLLADKNYGPDIDPLQSPANITSAESEGNIYSQTPGVSQACHIKQFRFFKVIVVPFLQ